MGRENELLTVKHVSSNSSITASQSRIVRFNVGMGPKESLILRKLVVYVSPSDIIQTTNWALLQKDEAQDDIAVTNPFFRNGDKDILARGIFNFNTATTNATPQRQINRRVDLDFDPPFILPRSPSFEIHVSASTFIVISASIYYTKRKESDSFMNKLLMKWIGRKQNVVSNIAPTIDE